MFEVIQGLGDGIVAVRATGKVRGDDYRDVLTPAIEAITAAGHQVRLLLEFGDEFEGYEPSGVMADATMGLGNLRSFERIAVVTDTPWLREALSLFGGFMPGEVRVFALADDAEARAWISG